MRKAKKLSLMLISFMLAFFPFNTHGWAQVSNAERWEPTIVIGGEGVEAMWPTVVADPYGRVHVFWVQPYEDYEPGVAAIMHRMQDENDWNVATDIVMRDTWVYSHPDAVFSTDTAYLIWSEWTGLYFSSAPIDQVDDPRGWTVKQPIASQTGIEQSRIVRGSGGILHVAYTRLAGGLGGDGNIYYIQSSDGGSTWSEPLALNMVPDSATYASITVRMILDQASIVHVVWAEESAPSWISRSVYYTRRLPDSGNWTDPIVLSDPNPDNILWEAAPSIVVDSKGDLHLVWVCGVVTNRCYRYSLDNGENWSPTERILGRFESLAGWDDLVADAEGGIHFVAQLRSPENVYHAQKLLGSDWGIPFPAYTLPEATGAHYVSAVLTQGNLLHVVSTSDRGGAIWYGMGVLPVNSLPVLPVPTLIMPDVGQPTGLILSTPTQESRNPEQTNLADIPDTGQLETPGSSGSVPILAGTAVSLVIIMITASWVLFFRRRQ